MFNKLYDKIKEIFLKNYRFLIFLVLIFIIFTIRLPYTIEAPGGYINVTKRIEMDNAYTSKGSFNMAYVSEVSATLPTLFYAWLNPNWDISKNEDILLENETIDDLLFRNKLALKEANNNAIMVAYRKAGFDYEIVEQKFYVAYLDATSETDLKVGDLIIEVDGKKIADKSEISQIVASKDIGDEIKFKVKNNNKNYERIARVKEIDNSKVVGIVIYELLELKTNPVIKIKSSSSESGPSGGLMTALAIYNSLVEEDITKGNIIIGTGMIDSKGNVGSIGGVKYKLLGAIKGKAKIFIVPSGENYLEAITLKEKNDYDIEIVGVSTFDEALEFLENYHKKS
ncbi:MAG: PDZ domain-containing protein [Bacilli bacterium]|nr:PDZ domain-containing protein [Bacilli bacterium]